MMQFKGGVHPPEHKELTEEKPIRKVAESKIVEALIEEVRKLC